MSTITTTPVTAETVEILLTNAVSAIQSFGADGDQRAVKTVARVFTAGVTPEALLSKAAVINAKGKEVNLPSHKAIVRAAWALHTLGDFIDAEVALNYARTIGDELMILVNQAGTSTEVRHATIEAMWEAKTDARNTRRAESMATRAALKAVLPKTVEALTKAVEAMDEAYTLSAEETQFLADIETLIKDLRA